MRFSVSRSINPSSVHPGCAEYLVLTQALDPSGDPRWSWHWALYLVIEEHTTHVSHHMQLQAYSSVLSVLS